MALSDLSPSTRGGCHDKTGGITIHNINISVKYNHSPQGLHNNKSKTNNTL